MLARVALRFHVGVQGEKRRALPGTIPALRGAQEGLSQTNGGGTRRVDANFHFLQIMELQVPLLAHPNPSWFRRFGHGEVVSVTLGVRRRRAVGRGLCALEGVGAASLPNLEVSLRG